MMFSSGEIYFEISGVRVTESEKCEESYCTELIQSATLAILRKTPGLPWQLSDQASSPTSVQRPEVALQTRGAPPSAWQTS